MSIKLRMGGSYFMNGACPICIDIPLSDCTYNNIMFDATPMYPDGFHPIDTNYHPAWTGPAKHYSRTERPVRYLLIDFGLSVQFADTDIYMASPARGGDASAPEHRPHLLAARVFHNPFPTDVYYIGNLVRRQFIEVSSS